MNNASRKQSDRTPPTAGFIGVGIMGQHHAKAFKALGGSIVAASASSPQSKNFEEFRRVAPNARFETPEALLEEAGVDFIIASLPWDMTESYLPRLLACDKPMLIEKPIALHSGVLSDILEDPNVKTKNKRIGFNRRYYKTVERVKERLARGGLKHITVTISEDIDSLTRRHGETILPHVLPFSSSHILDLMLHLLGNLSPVKIYASSNKIRRATALSYNGLLETSEKIPVFLSLNMSDPSPVGMRFRFDDETTWVLSPLERLRVYDRYEVTEPTLEVPIRVYSPHASEEIIEQGEGKPGIYGQMEDLVYNSGRRGATIEESLALLSFIESLQGSV